LIFGFFPGAEAPGFLFANKTFAYGDGNVKFAKHIS